MFFIIVAAFLFLAVLAPPGFSCDDCEPTVVDGQQAYEHSLRAGRDEVEGFWGIYYDWQPEGFGTKRHGMAIVKNDYEIYPEADYLGVVTCDSPGCRKGEVKLILEKTDEHGVFRASLIVTEDVTASGLARLTKDDEDGRENAALDMREVKYNGIAPAKWIVRMLEG
jgi:hypothetical protein